MMPGSARAFCPAHVTGFFTIHLVKDPLRSGSTGAGFTIDRGAVTSVFPAGETTVLLDGKPIDAHTTLKTLELIGAPPVRVETRWGLPVGAGLSASGAGALSSAIAANLSAGLELPYSRMVAAAHVAEVENRTGLGCIAAQSTGGVVVRLAPGVPLAVDRLAVPDSNVFIACVGRMSTPEVLSDAGIRRSITEHGRRALSALLRHPTMEEFFVQSRRFATGTGLLDGRTLDVVEAVEAAGGMASMAMLGRTVFSTTPDGLKGIPDVFECRISSLPARALALDSDIEIGRPGNRYM